MKNAFRATLVVFRLTGLLQLVVGVVFWTGHALNLIPLHMMIGSVFVLALWALAGLGARSGAPPGLVALAFAWGVVVPAFGVTQARILPGDWHWVIRSLHLLTAIIAMGIGNRIALRAGFAPRRERPRPPVLAGWPEGGGL